jgi:nitrogen-specific signal transduction histidine kinase
VLDRTTTNERRSERPTASIDRVVYEGTSDAVLVVDGQGSVVERNRVADRLFVNVCALGECIWRCPEDLEAAIAVCAGRAEDFESVVLVAGRHCSVRLVAAQGGDGDETGRAVVFLRDQSRLLAAESEVARLGRLRLLGNLLSGLGHDLQNVFSAAAGFAQLAIENVPNDSDGERILRNTHEASEVAARWMHLISGAAGPGRVDMVAKIEIAVLLEDVRRLLEKSVFSGRAVVTRGTVDGYVWAQSFEAVHLIAGLIRDYITGADVRESLVIEVWTEPEGHRRRVVVGVSVSGLAAKPWLLEIGSRLPQAWIACH